ncbi:MAG: dihydropteroate synthase, partial [Planctomycetes bacterium]|nr:dihydropteroate synthase [Planctomycetota bacterium]
ADVLDIGGESTRPGYRPVPPDEQARRVVPVIRALRRQTETPISIDTTRAEVAAAALDAGADWINDTTALAEDPGLARLAARSGAPLILMHRFDPPRLDGASPRGRALVVACVATLEHRAERAAEAGVERARIVLDPGLGFGTLFLDNLTLMADVSPWRRLPYPLLFGPSRKSFLGQLTGRPASERIHGTAAAVATLALQGVEIVRVHDVAAMADVVAVADALRNARANDENME